MKKGKPKLASQIITPIQLLLVEEKKKSELLDRSLPMHSWP
jgi:hypothetical protein